MALVMQALFKKEVSETFLRCVKMGYDQDLAVIELNGLKIAEDRTFADCARHVFASILDLCLPPPATCKAEYRSLYQSTAPDVGSQVHRPPLTQQYTNRVHALGRGRRRSLAHVIITLDDDPGHMLTKVNRFSVNTLCMVWYSTVPHILARTHTRSVTRLLSQTLFITLSLSLTPSLQCDHTQRIKCDGHKAPCRSHVL